VDGVAVSQEVQSPAAVPSAVTHVICLVVGVNAVQYVALFVEAASAT